MHPRPQLRLLPAALVAVFSTWAASCAVPLGPGYTIEKQQVRVRFTPEPEPRIRIQEDFQMKNTGTQPLQAIEMRLPGRRHFHYEHAAAWWDTTALLPKEPPENSRNTLLVLNAPWSVSARHTLRLEVEFSPVREGETALGFSSDAFFLPAAGWSVEFLAPRGLFSSGGVPPKLWELLVAVPDGFEMHTSGQAKKSQRKNGELTLLAEQSRKDFYPFVIAGRYRTTQMGKGRERIHLWTRSLPKSEELREASDSFERVFAAYNGSFGERSPQSQETWIVECPTATNCFPSLSRATARLLDEEEPQRTGVEMISQDTMVVDLTPGTSKLAVAAAPSLAASWLGYGQNPGFYEQQPPLSLLPPFAAALGRDAAAGTDSRAETIRRALRLVPASANPHQAEDRAVVRAKSFLFFYALQDHFGREVFRKAIAHMLYARRERGFGLNDFIAAFEQESHQNTAEFVRKWMKHPGVPDEFRARYEGAAAPIARFHATSRLEPQKETTP